MENKPQDQKLYRWVKASEREPNERSIYFVIEFDMRHGVEDGIYKSTRIYDPADKWLRGYDGQHNQYEVIEWLEEIPQPEVLNKEEGVSAEEILENHIGDVGVHNPQFYPLIIKAMESYASQFKPQEGKVLSDEEIGKINGLLIHKSDILSAQYYDGGLSYGTEIKGEVVYYDFGYKIFDGNNYHRLDSFVWFTDERKKGFKLKIVTNEPIN